MAIRNDAYYCDPGGSELVDDRYEDCDECGMPEAVRVEDFSDGTTITTWKCGCEDRRVEEDAL